MPNVPEAFVDTRSKSDTLFMLPSLVGDAFVRSINRRRFFYAPAYASALFLTLVRRLPLEEIEMDSPHGVCLIKMLGNVGKYGILMPKCKYLRTKTLEFEGKITKDVKIVQAGNACFSICHASDSDMIPKHILRRGLLSDRGENIIASAAVSAAGDSVSVKAIFAADSDRSIPLILASAVAERELLCFLRGQISVDVNGCEYHFVQSDGELFAFEPSPQLLTFHAPDF